MKKPIKGFIEHNRPGIVIMLFLIALTGSLLGYRYHRYTVDAPEFCNTCHMMRESFISWQKSKHWQIKCQSCHRMSVLEQNRLLVSYVAKGQTGPQEQKHGSVAPWKACRQCHIDEAVQGSLGVRGSYGHARHVFMENLGCGKCHSGQLHRFAPDERACSGCHTDKLVHGLGMEGLSCLKCHSYREEVRHMVSNERCLGCHKGVNTAGPMAALKCFDCHKPHRQIKPESGDCLTRCHGNEVQVGQHRVHVGLRGMGCLDCHKAHRWVVGRKEAKGLCDRCHPLKDPASFIY